MKDFEQLAKDMSYSSRAGDLVRVQAPAGSMASEFNDCEGEILRYSGGWVVVRLHGRGDARFRADELLAL